MESKEHGISRLRTTKVVERSVRLGSLEAEEPSTRPCTCTASRERRRPPAGAGIPLASAQLLRSADGEDEPAITEHYQESEYLLPGRANTYTGATAGPARTTSVGNPYLTRMLVRFPRRPADFTGRVVIEPFNTSGRAERDALWSRVASLLQDQGDAWIGVSERASAVAALKDHDRVRYADINIAANDFAWDILRDVGVLVKRGDLDSPLRHLAVKRVYLGGYSQSGAEIATFATTFHKFARMPDGSAVYDGYLPAARSGTFTPLSSGSSRMPRFEFAPFAPVDVPVVNIEPQSDVEGYTGEVRPGLSHTNPGGAESRRDDADAPDDRYRLYEVAGAPHVAKVDGCHGDGSSFPTSAFVRGALVRLFRWAEQGVAPPTAERIDLATLGTISEAKVDEYGNAVGGVRSPFLDVPLARYEVHSTPGVLCRTAGRETLLPIEVLTERYGDAAAYVAQFTASLDATIHAGYLLQADRAAILSMQTAKALSAFGPAGV